MDGRFSNSPGSELGCFGLPIWPDVASPLVTKPRRAFFDFWIVSGRNFFFTSREIYRIFVVVVDETEEVEHSN
ncbi:uncharacterized protein LY89DRAFT_104003 [Mollisia scopiformis]|uniref:Uncharacterized protein n=1 Tax=Mollisia scopiformis TaxID=149040 RepID=A0A194X4M1_MOLSC|nr:uncharacterized protein LY89DRAFT_104003 [Mollisia scopiformis]KUJ15125.1 hypothetical protein LY89DRAFT_104003 [Mollisia scopiformis]